MPQTSQKRKAAYQKKKAKWTAEEKEEEKQREKEKKRRGAILLSVTRRLQAEDAPDKDLIKPDEVVPPTLGTFIASPDAAIIEAQDATVIVAEDSGEETDVVLHPKQNAWAMVRPKRLRGEHETPDEKKERIERQQKKRRKGYYSAESRDKRNQEIYVEKNQEMMERVHSLSSSGTIETLDLFALMTMGRCSEQWFEGGYGEMIVGNDEFADHYIEQFFGGILPISRGSVAFNFTKAWMSFPTVHPGRGLQPLLPDANTNRLCQAIWIEHLEGIPPGQTAILLFRGIDGGSIDPAAWMGLLNRWPGIHIEIAFACETTFVTARAPANANWFMRARPYDGFLYWQFPLAELVATMIGNRQDAKYIWLLSEWALGWQARIDSEIANQSRNAARIIAASLVYRNLRTRGRTGLSNDQKGDTY